ncbi:FadR/GntR family transcriptional regulator [Aureimonas sp. ME7]|uniref:FadR/GntR family transcriptional regulator n=1 Tax=Aureimonas sp. ME7 TaxID=2744252 RepID=UPI0015F71B8B|nr:FadR/GntR family transcriptional regulator [Aureimonas sp. ME7]
MIAASTLRGRAQRLHGSIAQDIGTAILTGTYRPGDLLANEVSFSEKLSVSRTAYREAVRILAAKGLVSSRPKAGTRINPRANWNFLDPEVLRWVFENGPPPPAFVRDLFELRQIVEPAAASFAADRRTAAHLLAMREALDAMSRHGLGVEEGRNADRQFHETILLATGNEVLGTLASGISAAVRWTTLFKARDGRMPRDPVPEHARVLTAIEDGNAVAARSAMAMLVELAFNDIRSVDPRLVDVAV